jgi:hypothetical protein
VEAARCSEEAFWRCYGRTGPAGGWLCINGTLEGSSGWFAKLSKEWQAPNAIGGRAFRIPAWSNLTKYPGGRQDPKILAFEQTMPPDLFAERIAGEPVPPRGLVFPQFRYTHHVRPVVIGQGPNPETIYLPENLELQLWIDPGYGEGYSVLVAALYQGRVFLLDEVYTDHYTTKEVIQICKQKPWWSRVSHVVMDIAGEQHGGSGESAAEIWRSHSQEGAGLRVIGKKIPNIKDKLDLVASYLIPNPESGLPKLVFSTSCPRTIEEFGDKYKWRLGPDGEKLGHKPIEAHDHSVSAIAYGLNMNFGYVHKERPERKPTKQFWEYRKR